MDQQWKHLSDRVEQAETAWGSVVTSLPEQLQISQPPGSLPKSSISSALAKLVGLVKALGERDDIDPVLTVDVLKLEALRYADPGGTVVGCNVYIDGVVDVTHTAWLRARLPSA